MPGGKAMNDICPLCDKAIDIHDTINLMPLYNRYCHAFCWYQFKSDQAKYGLTEQQALWRVDKIKELNTKWNENIKGE